MGATNEAAVLGLELERVSPKVPVLFDRDDTFYSTIEKRNVETVSSREMRIPLEMKPGGSFRYYDPNGGDMGRGTGPAFDKAVISPVHNTMGVEWTLQSQMSTDSARKAVLNSFRHLLAKSMAEYRRQIDSQCMTAGTGVLANPDTLSTSAAGDLWTVPATDDFGVRLLRDQQPVGVYDSTLATKRGEATIDFYDRENRQVRTTPAIAGAAATDKLVASGLTASPVGLFGIQYHHSNAATGTWLGFDRSTTPAIRANRVTASGALALPFARLALNKIGDRVGIDNMEKVVAWMHPGQKAAYEELGQLVSLIHKQPKEEALDLYFGDNMQMAGAPVKCSYSWPKTRIDFVNYNIWGRAELQPAGFHTVDGQKIFPIRGSSGGLAAAMIFYIISSFNLFINNPAMASYISDLTIPTGY